MKVRLQEAMPDVPLQELREQREIHENDRIESDDEQEQINENQEAEPNDDDEHNCNEGGAVGGVEFQYDKEHDVTF